MSSRVDMDALAARLGAGRDPASVRRRIEAMEALLERAFVIPGTNRRFGLDVALDLIPIVGDVVAAAGKDAGAPIKLVGFVRFQLGEGIEKQHSDFAAEVAAAAGTNKPEAEL